MNSEVENSKIKLQNNQDELLLCKKQLIEWKNKFAE